MFTGETILDLERLVDKILPEASVQQHCHKCGSFYNDETCSTVCPHRGIGFCVVCDCVVCICTPETAGKAWERSTNATKLLATAP